MFMHTSNQSSHEYQTLSVALSRARKQAARIEESVIAIPETTQYERSRALLPFFILEQFPPFKKFASKYQHLPFQTFSPAKIHTPRAVVVGVVYPAHFCVVLLVLDLELGSDLWAHYFPSLGTPLHSSDPLRDPSHSRGLYLRAVLPGDDCD
jgi:hypothetical protein